MKANKTQIDAAQTLKLCLDCMVDTNDITSPTIYNDIETLVRLEMEEYVDEDLRDEIVETMHKLYDLIKKLK